MSRPLADCGRRCRDRRGVVRGEGVDSNVPCELEPMLALRCRSVDRLVTRLAGGYSEGSTYPVERTVLGAETRWCGTGEISVRTLGRNSVDIMLPCSSDSIGPTISCSLVMTHEAVFLCVSLSPLDSGTAGVDSEMIPCLRRDNGSAAGDKPLD